MVSSEFMENASLCTLFCGSVQKNPGKRFLCKNSEYYLPILANVNCIKLVCIANSHSYFVISSYWVSGEHQKMFPADTADFYQVFLHIKQIISPSESQTYILKKNKKYRYYRVLILCSKSIDSIGTKFFRYLSSLNSTHKIHFSYKFVWKTRIPTPDAGI